MQYVDVMSHIGGALVGLCAAQVIKYRTRARQLEQERMELTPVEAKMEELKKQNKQASFMKRE